MPAAEVPEARKTLESGESVTHVGLLGSAMLQVKAALPDGGTCVLQYDYVPDFTSRELRDALPDPQTLATVLLGVLFAAAMALIATRAARVISAKMRPLAQAAAHIERQELDFEVGSANVPRGERRAGGHGAHARRAAGVPRGALASGGGAARADGGARARLEDPRSPWCARTPEYLSEEEGLSPRRARGRRGGSRGRPRRLDAYVRLIIDASRRGGGAGVRRERVDAASWANACDEAARRVADARGVRLETVQEGVLRPSREGRAASLRRRGAGKGRAQPRGQRLRPCARRQHGAPRVRMRGCGSAERRGRGGPRARRPRSGVRAANMGG